jgi:hypothetical protein
MFVMSVPPEAGALCGFTGEFGCSPTTYGTLEKDPTGQLKSRENLCGELEKKQKTNRSWGSSLVHSLSDFVRSSVDFEFRSRPSVIVKRKSSTHLISRRLIARGGQRSVFVKQHSAVINELPSMSGKTGRRDSRIQGWIQARLWRIGRIPKHASVGQIAADPLTVGLGASSLCDDTVEISLCFLLKHSQGGIRFGRIRWRSLSQNLAQQDGNGGDLTDVR